MPASKKKDVLLNKYSENFNKGNFGDLPASLSTPDFGPFQPQVPGALESFAYTNPVVEKGMDVLNALPKVKGGPNPFAFGSERLKSHIEKALGIQPEPTPYNKFMSTPLPFTPSLSAYVREKANALPESYRTIAEAAGLGPMGQKIASGAGKVHRFIADAEQAGLPESVGSLIDLTMLGGATSPAFARGMALGPAAEGAVSAASGSAALKGLKSAVENKLLSTAERFVANKRAEEAIRAATQDALNLQKAPIQAAPQAPAMSESERLAGFKRAIEESRTKAGIQPPAPAGPDAVYIGSMKDPDTGAPIPLFNVIKEGHPSLGSTLSTEGLQARGLAIPAIPEPPVVPATPAPAPQAYPMPMDVPGLNPAPRPVAEPPSINLSQRASARRLKQAAEESLFGEKFKNLKPTTQKRKISELKKTKSKELGN